MSFVVKLVKNVVQVIVQGIVEVAEMLWEDIVVPLLGWVFGLIGIDDETIVTAQKVSVAVFNDYGGDLVQDAIVRATIRKIQTNTKFFPNYMQEMYKTKGQMKAYYNYGESGDYIHGLPKLSIAGVRLPNSDLSTILNAISNTRGGASISTLDIHSGYLQPLEHFENILMQSYGYTPYNSTLSKADVYGVVRHDWILNKNIVYDVGSSTYPIHISRAAQLAKFWVEGVESVTESDIALFKIRCNRQVPSGRALPISLVYSGTAVDGVNYSEIASVTMAALQDEVEIQIQTHNLSTGASSSQFSISIGSINNTGGVFEHVLVDYPTSVTCTIASDDALVLTTKDVLVQESGSAVVQVKLEQATTGPFTVDYGFIDIDTIGGVDYDNTVGTLSFSGVAGQVLDIVVPINADLVDDDTEQFKVVLTSCTDNLVDISRFSTVTIKDNTDDYEQSVYGLSDVIVGSNYTSERYMKVKYYLTGTSSNEWYYWFYRYADNIYNIEPSSEALEQLDMLPVVVLRKDKVFCNVDKQSVLYKSTKKLMDNLSLSVDEFIANIAQSPGADLNSITDAYLNFSMLPSIYNEVMSKILYNSFFEVIVTNGVYSEIGEYSASFSEGDINNTVVWTNQEYIQNIAGVIAEKGKCTHYTQKLTEGSILHLQFQKFDSSYELIKLHNLSSLTSVDYGGYHQVATTKLWSDETNSVDANFSMAISWNVFASLTGKEQTAVYRYILRMDLYSLTITELRWYETESFSSLFNVVMIAIAVFTFGQSLVVQGFFVAVSTLLVNYAIGELVVFVAEATGSAVLAAVVAVVASSVAQGSFDLEVLLDAENLTKTITSFADSMVAAQSIIVVSKMEDLIKDGMDIEEARAKLDKEEKAREAVKNDSPITGEFLNSLKSLESQIISAIDSQYQFDETFGYGILENYHANNLRAEIT